MRLQKARLNLLLLIVALFIFPNSVAAHSFGQPPYFKVNGLYSNLYPVPTTSLEDFNLPQDQTPENYLVNQAIKFEIDTSKMSVPADVVAKTTFTWDFGDGSKDLIGLTQSHTYTKIGSYILSIHAKDSTVSTPQLLETAELNIVPDKSYQLPKAIIKVNNQTSKDPLTDVLNFKLDQPVNFDGSASNSSHGKIVSYTWDFGDQKTGTSSVITHTYANDLSQIFPVLRIKDDQGFFADSFVEIQNSNISIEHPLIVPTSTPSGTVGSSKSTQNDLGRWLLIGTIILVVGGLFVSSKSKPKK